MVGANPRFLVPALAVGVIVAVVAVREGWKRYAARPVEPSRAPVVHTALADTAPLHFVTIPGGRFTRGSPEEESGREPEESPLQEVTVAAFQMAVTEVTQAQWMAIRDGNPSLFHEDPRHPVENVNWCEALEFANELSEHEGLEPAYTVDKGCIVGGAVTWDPRADGYRLPTETEWEYAARAGSTTPYFNGSDESALDDAGWYALNSTGHAHPVGRKDENPWGLYDVHGNVWEWVWARFRDRYPEPPEPSPAVLEGGEPVFRGGAWKTEARFCRSAARGHSYRAVRAENIGFRLARTP